MKRFVVRKVKSIIKRVLAVMPFGIDIMASIGFKWAYKSNFSKIKFQGQFLQDMVAYLYLSRKQNGFFIDIGANDGLIHNNTYIFEQIGWHGICVEPQPDIFHSYLKHIRKCDCYNVALSSKSDTDVKFFQARGAPGLSGISEGMSEEHKNQAGKYGKTEIINIKTMTFDELMGKYPSINYIDFMSIDVEGHEMEILETINFRKYSFGFLTIEKNEPEKIVNHLKKNGYRKFMEIGADIMFIPEISPPPPPNTHTNKTNS